MGALPLNHTTIGPLCDGDDGYHSCLELLPCSVFRNKVSLHVIDTNDECPQISATVQTWRHLTFLVDDNAIALMAANDDLVPFSIQCHCIFILPLLVWVFATCPETNNKNAVEDGKYYVWFQEGAEEN